MNHFYGQNFQEFSHLYTSPTTDNFSVGAYFRILYFGGCLDQCAVDILE